jgi:homoserine kinase
MPDSVRLVDALRADGVPAVVSGAGPTVLAFVADDEPGLPRAEDVVARCPEGWAAHALAVDGAGVRVVG